MKDKNWLFIYETFDPKKERQREALCTLGNGYFATRGAFAESDADEIHYPGTYLAGGYNRLETRVAEKVIENEDLVNLPNWLTLKFRLNGGPFFDLQQVKILSFYQELDLKNGLLTRKVHFSDESGRQTILSDQRFVHMQYPHLAAIKSTITAVNWSGTIEYCSALNGEVKNCGVPRYEGLNNKHLIALETKCLAENVMYLKMQTSQSELRLALATRVEAYKQEKKLPFTSISNQRPGYVSQTFSFDVTLGETISLEKVVALYTSRDQAISECGLEAKNAIFRAPPFDILCNMQKLAWADLWNRFNVEISHKTIESNIQLILRLHIFHLIQTASPNSMDLDVGVPARGLHGEAYRGHIFWDQLFILPSLNFRVPEITRSLLQYRYRRLPEARFAAQAAGFQGAMYPWQSASNGREESQRIHQNPISGRWIQDNTFLQRHVNGAVAYDVWNYYQITQDLEFLSYYGAEMIIEIARFFSSLSHYNPELDRFEILGVVGPDEYHDSYPDAPTPGLNNNSYTNILAVWVLLKALTLKELLPGDHWQELCLRLNLHNEEMARWEEISRKMRLLFFEEGILSQFEGYEDLKEFDWEGYRKKYGDIHRLDRILEAESDTPNRYKVSKQADVLMLFYLFSARELHEIFTRLGYPFDKETIPKNIAYYIQRTSHGSSLSRVIHSWVYARLDRKLSWTLFSNALMQDVSDVQKGTTAEGIHLGAMATTVDIVQRCYTGLQVIENVLWINPCLPDEFEKLKMSINYRGNKINFEITTKEIFITLPNPLLGQVRIGYNKEVHCLDQGTSHLQLPLQST